MPVRERGVAVDALPAAAVDALLAVAGPDVPAPLAMVEIRLLGGAIARGPEVPNAVAGRDAAFNVFVIGAPFGPPIEATAAAMAASRRRAPAVGVRRPAELRRHGHTRAGRPAVERRGPRPAARDPRPCRPDGPLRHEHPHRLSHE